MAVTAVSETTLLPAFDAVQGSDNNSLESETMDFMNILLAQMQNQNPLEPMDSAEMMSQLAQLTMLTELTKLTDAIEQLSTANTISYASSLIGKEVVAGPSADLTIEGTVDSVEIRGNDVFLMVGENIFAISELQRIMDDDDSVDDVELVGDVEETDVEVASEEL